MINSSCIYKGTVVHKRFKPKKHFFKYNVFSMLIDLDEINEMDKRLSIFSFNKFNILSFFLSLGFGIFVYLIIEQNVSKIIRRGSKGFNN